MIDEPSPSNVPESSGHFSEKHGPEALDIVPVARTCIADTIAYFASAEANIRILLLSCFGQNIDATDELIAAARADHFVQAFLPVAISNRGREDMNQAVASFIGGRKKVKQYRDLFAHAIFAARSDLPSRILMMKPDPYRQNHRDLLADLGLESHMFSLPSFTFQVWAESDFLAARSMAVAYLNASHAMSVCLARQPEEVGAWRSALEAQGLLEEPPHSAIYRSGHQ